MAERGVDHRLFVSYAREDAEWTKRVVRALSQYDIQPWWDDRLRAGRRWHPQIKEALDRAELAICLLSEGFFASSFIPDEELWEIRRRCPDLDSPRDAPSRTELVDRPIDVLPLLISRTDAYERFGLHALEWPKGFDPDTRLSELDEDTRIDKLQTLAKQIWQWLGSPGPDDRWDAAVDDRDGGGGAPRLSPSEDLVESQGDEPSAPTTLRGRRRDVEHLVELLAQPGNGAMRSPVVVIEGLPGVGKSALAGAVVRSLDVRALFPDGIWWLTVGQSADVADVQRRLLRSMGVHDERWQDADDRSRALVHRFFRRQALLVLDDVWSPEILEAFDVLSPLGRLLVTTRRAQDVVWSGVHPYRLEGLAGAAALKVLADNAGVAVDQLPAPAEGIVDLAEGIPLALAAAGAQVRFGAGWQQVASSMQKAAAVFGPSPRSGALGAVLSSIRALEGTTGSCYRALAVFADDVDIPIALLERYWTALGLDIEARGVQVMIDELAARNLVTVTGTAVRLHDDQRDVLLLLSASLVDLHRCLVDSARSMLDGPSAWWSLPESEVYLEAHLARHLDGAGLDDELVATLTDLRWVLRRLARSGVEAVVADLARTAEDRPSVAPIRRLVARSGHRAAGLAVSDVAATLLPAIIADPDLRDQVELVERMTGPVSLRAITMAPEEPHPALVRAVGAGHVISIGHGQAPIGAVRGLAAIDDGRRVVCGVREASPTGAATEFEWVDTLRTLDLETGLWTDRRTGTGGFVNAVASDPGGHRIVTGSTEGVVTVWDQRALDGPPVALSGSHDGVVTCVAVSPDGTLAVSGATDGVVKVWDLFEGAPAMTSSGSPVEHRAHGSPIWSVAFASDGSVVSGSANGEVHRWDPTTGSARPGADAAEASVIRLAASIGALAVAPTGHRVAVGAADGSVQVWELGDVGFERCALELRGHTAGVSAATFAPDGSWLATAGSDRAIRFWEPDTGGLLSIATGHCDVVKALVAGDGGSSLVSVAIDNSVRVWDPSVRVTDLDPDRSIPVSGLASVPGADRFVASTWDGGLRVLSSATGETQPSPPPRPGGKAVRCAMTRDARRAVTASREDRRLVVWDLDTNRQRLEIEGHGDLLTCCAMAPDDTVWSASEAGDVRRWDIGTGELLEEKETLASPLWSIAVGPDGTLLAGGRDPRACLWRPGERSPLLLEGHAGPGVGCHVAGDLAVTSGADGTIRLWHAGTGSPVEDADGAPRIFRGHSAAVIATAVSPSADRLASVSLDCTIRLWDLEGGPLCAFRAAGWLGDVTWVAEDRIAAVGGPGVYLLQVTAAG